MKNCNRIVVKVGTSTLTYDNGNSNNILTTVVKEDNTANKSIIGFNEFR